MEEKKNEIILFENQGVKLEVNLKDETVWLTQAQMSELFKKAKSTINEHIRNIYKEGELNKSRRIYKGHSLIQDVGDYTVVDIETTSLDSFHGEILEISAIKVRNKKEVDNFSELIKTNEEIGYFTTNLTGITNEMMVKEGKELEEVLQSFKAFLGNDIIN